MIHRCRPDFDLAFLAEALRRAEASEGEPLTALGGRRLFPVPQARDGLSWFLRRVGIGSGDEVAVPTLVCEAVADGILEAGARPVTFGNSGRDFGPSLESCEQALSGSAKAVIVPHLFGIPANLEGFQRLCASRGVLLVEDCAPCVMGQAAGGEVGSIGDCVLHSFKFDKPLALGWGGAVSLSAAMLESIGPPQFPTLSAAEDRLLAASLLVQHALTDSACLQSSLLSMSYALERLIERPQLADELVSLIRHTSDHAQVAAWCDSRFSSPRDGLVSRAKAWLRRATPAWVKRRLAPAPRPDRVAQRFGGKSLLPGGLCERVLAAQERAVRAGAFGARRARIAAIYASSLDRDKFLVPEAANVPAFWLRFPAALRRDRARRDRLCAEVGRRLQAEIGPHTWAMPLHLIPRLRPRLRVGPGSAETEPLVGGLLNLPVHSQVTEDLAGSLADALNRA